MKVPLLECTSCKDVTSANEGKKNTAGINLCFYLRNKKEILISFIFITSYVSWGKLAAKRKMTVGHRNFCIALFAKYC